MRAKPSFPGGPGPQLRLCSTGGEGLKAATEENEWPVSGTANRVWEARAPWARTRPCATRGARTGPGGAAAPGAPARAGAMESRDGDSGTGDSRDTRDSRDSRDSRTAALSTHHSATASPRNAGRLSHSIRFGIRGRIGWFYFTWQPWHPLI